MTADAKLLATWAATKQDPDAASALAEAFHARAQGTSLATQLVAIGYLIGHIEATAPRSGIVGPAVCEISRTAAKALQLLDAQAAGRG